MNAVNEFRPLDYCLLRTGFAPPAAAALPSSRPVLNFVSDTTTADDSDSSALPQRSRHSLTLSRDEASHLMLALYYTLSPDTDDLFRRLADLYHGFPTPEQ